MDKMDAQFAAIIEDSLRKFPDEELSSLYVRYTHGEEKDLYDLIMKKVKAHLNKIINTSPPAPKESFLFKSPPPADKEIFIFKSPPPAPKESFIFKSPPPAPKKPSPGPIRDMLSARKKLDFEIESCIRDSDVYKYTLSINGGNEQGAYTEAYKYYGGSTPK